MEPHKKLTEICEVLSSDSLDFWVEGERGYSVEKRDGKPFLNEKWLEEGWSLRYFSKDGRFAIAYGTGLEKEKVLNASLIAKELSKEGISGVLPELPETYPKVSKPEIEDISSEKLLKLVEELEEITFSQGIDRLERISLKTGIEWVFLSFRDNRLYWEIPFVSFLVSVIVKGEKKEASSYEWFHGTEFSLKEIKDRIKSACIKAKALCKAKKGGTKRVPLLFPPFFAVDLLEVLKFSFLGSEVVKGRSRLKNKVGKKVFSEAVSIVDDGTAERLLETRPFDDEGMPQQKTLLVEKGTLKSFLWDSFWGKAAGELSTGNARRPSLESPPKVSATNFYLLPGTKSPEEILRSFPEVVEVIEILGAHTADPISGKFSVGISGILYKNGEPVEVLSEMAISEDIFELFSKVVEVGNDLKFYGSTGSPSLLVERVDLG